MRRHAEEKPYKCNYFNTGVDTEMELQDHIDMCASERVHICQEFGKGFKTKQNLTVHFVVHSVVRSFQCDQWDKSSNNYGGLYTHKKKVHEGVTYMTVRCVESSLERSVT